MCLKRDTQYSITLGRKHSHRSRTVVAKVPLVDATDVARDVAGGAAVAGAWRALVAERAHPTGVGGVARAAAVDAAHAHAGQTVGARLVAVGAKEKLCGQVANKGDKGGRDEVRKQDWTK